MGSTAAVDDKLYLFAFVNFQPGKYEAWQKAYDDLAVYVWDKEYTTETYYFGIPFDYADDITNTDVMFAYEIYENRDSLYGPHFNSPAMKKFLESAFPVMSTGFDLQHYSLVAGFLDGPGDKRACGIMQDINIICKSKAARDTVVQRLKGLGTNLVGEKTGGEVLTWTAYESQDNELGARILGRFKDQKAMMALNRRLEVMEFWAACKEKEIGRIEQRGYVENGKGWLHR